MNKYKHLIGIDEVGRGPLAGPVAVGAVLVYAEHYEKVTKLFPVVKDSKKLSPKMREVWVAKVREAEEAGFLVTAVSFVGVTTIDRKGIAGAIRIALARSLDTLSKGTPSTGASRVLLDGGLCAPSHYLHQQTIIKGDEKELAIALASIVAKVTRDAYMVKLAKKYPEYGFEKHKGYGTRAHYGAIKKNGTTPHHRKTFLRGIV